MSGIRLAKKLILNIFINLIIDNHFISLHGGSSISLFEILIDLELRSQINEPPLLRKASYKIVNIDEE